MANSVSSDLTVFANLRINSTAVATARRDPVSLRKQRALPWPSATAIIAVSPPVDTQYLIASWFWTPERTCDLPRRLAPVTRHCIGRTASSCDEPTTARLPSLDDSIFPNSANLRAARGTARVFSHNGILNGVSAIHVCSSGKRYATIARPRCTSSSTPSLAARSMTCWADNVWLQISKRTARRGHSGGTGDTRGLPTRPARVIASCSLFWKTAYSRAVARRR